MQESITELFNVTYQIRADAENPEVGFDRDQVRAQCDKIQEALLSESAVTLSKVTLESLQTDLSYLFKLQSYLPGSYEKKNGLTVKYSSSDDGVISMQVVHHE